MEPLLALLTSFLITISANIGTSEAACQYEWTFIWSYNPDLWNAPERWGEKFPNCFGKQQSPINIITANVERDSNLRNLELENYDKPLSVYLIKNDGHTVNITSLEKESVNRAITVNGEKYDLSYIQFHWGDKYYRGSEHIVDNIQYAFELQLVHKNKEGKHAVVSVLHESSLNNNGAFNVIVDSLKKIPYRGYQLANNVPIDLSKLVSNGCPIYRYTGSLTYPGCDEGVIWSICKNPSTIGYLQLDEFRKLISFLNVTNEDVTGCKLINNFRPIQPLNGRKVTSST